MTKFIIIHTTITLAVIPSSGVFCCRHVMVLFAIVVSIEAQQVYVVNGRSCSIMTCVTFLLASL